MTAEQVVAGLALVIIVGIPWAIVARIRKRAQKHDQQHREMMNALNRR